MANMEDLKRKVIELIDESHNQWAKMAFYGDPEVSSILENVYTRWERSGSNGYPIDYATKEELEILVSKAERYRNAGPEVAYAIVYGKHEQEERKEKKPKSLLRRLLGL